MTTRRYAQNTRVPVERSRLELEKILRRHGADEFGSYGNAAGIEVAFKLGGLRYRMAVDAPTAGPKGKPEALLRERWRMVVLLVRAKLEAVKAGLSTIEREFMAAMVMPHGDTLGDRLPDLVQVLAGGDSKVLMLPRKR